MTLSEKIFYCRKKAGMSQEALADILGVSRQAVSKWETGEAEPEIGKLRILAETFKVSADWLLSDAEPEAQGPEQGPEPVNETAYRHREEAAPKQPGFWQKAFARYGWLLGIYVSLVGGLPILLVGLVTKAFSSAADGFQQGIYSGDPAAKAAVLKQLGEMGVIHVTRNPVSTVALFIIGLGVIVIIAGLILAAVLKHIGSRAAK